MNTRDDQKRCLECGGDLKANSRTGILTCIYCNREFPKAVVGFEDSLQEIAHQRQLREFIKAEELCDSLLKEQPESSEAHWQALLASLGVLYVQEDGIAKPTFFSCSYNERESILDDEHYSAAVRYAPDEESKNYYMVKARELDVLLREFFELVKKEANYDIFISFKQTIEARVGDSVRTIETDDCRKAREIYEHLKDKYHVFFSPVSIGKDTGIQGEKYEPRILKALQSSQAMILVGFSEENLKSQWVENEWKRYKYYIDKNKKKRDSLILVYEKVMPRLPTALKDIEWPNFDVYDVKYLEKLEKKLEFVNSKKGLKSSITKKNLNTGFEESSDNIGYSNLQRTVISEDSGRRTIKIDPTEEQDLATAEGVLNHKRWSDAEKKYKQISKINPDCYRAYWGEFKARVKAENDIAVSLNIIDASEEDIYLLNRAISSSSDEQFSWKIIDTAMNCFENGYEWRKCKLIYEFLIKYIDVPRINKMHDILEKMCVKCVEQGNIKVSEEIFESARKIFIEEVKDRSIKFMKTYASALLQQGRFVLARKYFEQLAGVRSTANNYMNLLACRLCTTDVTQTKIKLIVDSTDDSSMKKPSELDIDEIIERIVICDSRERAAKMAPSTFKIAMPTYKVIPSVGVSPADLSIAVKSAAKFETLNEAHEFIVRNKLNDIHSTLESAQKAASVLESLGIGVLEIKQLPYMGAGFSDTVNQIVSAVKNAMNCDDQTAKAFVEQNKLYMTEYMQREDAETAVEKLSSVGVSGAEIIEDNPNTEKNRNIRTNIYSTLRKMLLFQVKNNAHFVHPIMETIVSCYRQLGDKDLLRETMLMVADAFVTERNFKQANIWYNELIIEDSNDAVAHWGTLKCKLRAVDDYSVSKHSNKLMNMQEFNNAINCADNDQNKYYMSVYYKEIPKPKKKKNEHRKQLDAKVIKEKIALYLKRFVNYVICAIAFMAGLVMVYDPTVYFKHVHFAAVIVIGGGILLIALIKLFMVYYNVRNSLLERNVVQNSAARNISCQILIILLSISALGIGMVMAKDRTYYLSSPDDFNIIINMPWSGEAHYILENDIDFGGEECSAYGVVDEFVGTFDGNGYTIKNMYVSDGQFKDGTGKLSEYSFGFFRTITESGVVKNLNVKDCLIKVTSNEYNNTYNGIIAGVNGGMISNCNVTDSYIFVKSTNYDSIVYVGGVAGATYKSIKSEYTADLDDVMKASYGDGSINECTFYNIDDSFDEYDDDNYKYGIAYFGDGEFYIDGIANGYDINGTDKSSQYSKFEKLITSRSDAYDEGFEDIFGDRRN